MLSSVLPAGSLRGLGFSHAHFCTHGAGKPWHSPLLHRPKAQARRAQPTALCNPVGSIRSGNREGAEPSTHQHGDTRSTREENHAARQRAELRTGKRNKTSREKSGDSRLSSQSQKCSTPTGPWALLHLTQGCGHRWAALPAPAELSLEPEGFEDRTGSQRGHRTARGPPAREGAPCRAATAHRGRFRRAGRAGDGGAVPQLRVGPGADRGADGAAAGRLLQLARALARSPRRLRQHRAFPASDLQR